VIGVITLDGYSFKHVARSGKRVVGLLFKMMLSEKITPVKAKLF